jgi:hypothetical protein
VQANRGLVFWGIALVTAGAVALAIQAAIIPADTARQAWRLWPVVLIVIGLSVIAARTPFALIATAAAALTVGALAGTLVAGIPDGVGLGCGGDIDDRTTADRTTADGTFSDSSAIVELDLNCGELRVGTQAGSGWALDAGFASGAEPDITSDGVTLRVEAQNDGVIGFADGQQDWDVTLPRDVAMDLRIEANAAKSTIGLAGTTLTRLDLDANAGEVALDLDGAATEELALSVNAGSLEVSIDPDSRLSGSVSANAGSLELCVDGDVSIEITANDNITFSHNLDESGLTREGDTWRSGDGPADVALDIEGNAASLTYTSGGCS